MKYVAILFMCNDELRAEMAISTFTEHNPNISLIVYNGGNHSKHVERLIATYNFEYIHGPNLWHTKIRHPPGSFSFEWFELLFKTYHKTDCDYLIFLETDVKCNRSIKETPKYDLSGVMVGCGPLEYFLLYDFWSNYLNDKPFEEFERTQWNHKFHTGMGGTAMSRNFFETCEKNLHLVEKCYNLLPMNAWQDVNISLLARYSGCTIGDWSEVSDMRGTMRVVHNGFIHDPLDENCALIHFYKI